LYGKAKWLEAMPPFQGGGDMIRTVTFEKTTYNDLPYKFEAGTPNIAGAFGLAAAIDYVDAVGRDAIAEHEADLIAYATERLTSVPGLRLIGMARQRAGAFSFVLEGIHAHDIGMILDTEGIAIRTGHHCTMPLMQRFGIPATARAALAMYNTREEIDVLVKGIHKVKAIFS
jgi:cysteine desulfurase/selenocysteine lyase